MYSRKDIFINLVVAIASSVNMKSYIILLMEIGPHSYMAEYTV